MLRKSTVYSYFESNKIRRVSYAVHLNALNLFTVHLSTFEHHEVLIKAKSITYHLAFFALI